MPGGNALKRRTRVPNGFDRAGCKFAKSVKIFPRERSDSKKRFFPQPVNPCPDTSLQAQRLFPHLLVRLVSQGKEIFPRIAVRLAPVAEAMFPGWRCQV